MLGRGHRLRVLHVGQFVGVVGHDHFLLAHQLPVVAVQRTVEDEHVVIGAGAGGARVRRVVGQARRQLHAALTGQVLPGLARYFHGIGGVLQHDRLTSAASRAGVVQLHLVIHVGIADGLVQVFVDRVVDERLAGGGQGRHACGVDVPGVVLGVDGHALVTQQVVPHRLGAVLRHRERYARQHVLDGQATVLGLGAGGVLHAVVQHALRQGHGAVGRIDIDAEGREALGQFHRGGAEHVLVLIDVLAVDHDHRLLAGEGIGTHAVARLEAGRRSGQAAVVGGNRAVGICSLVGADLGEAGTQLGRFGGRHSSVGSTGECDHKGSRHQSGYEFHLVSLLPVLFRQCGNQKVVLKVRYIAPRSSVVAPPPEKEE
ncbi:hypothetical protein D3C76_729900 [compost metagenome]